MNKELIINLATGILARHTAQAIGGAITASAIDLPALTHGQLDVQSFSALLSGVAIQTAVYWFARFKAKRAQKKAQK